MSILSSIRSRVGLIVGIIFVALLSFVLTDLFRSDRGLFGSGSGSGDIGEINGHTVTRPEFQSRINEIEAQQKRTLSEQELTQLNEVIWQELIEKHVFEPQYKELGLVVTTEELAEQMYGSQPSPYLNQWFSDRQTGQIMPDFAGPDGQLSGKAIRDFAKKMPAETEAQWAQIEIELGKMLLKEKYNTMVRKGFYVTTSQAKHEYADDNTKYTFKYIVKKYAEKADSLVTVSDAEMKEYYDANQHKFKQREDSRSMEYVAFDIFPSADDIEDQRLEMEKLITDFKAQKGKDDSSFVVGNTTSGMFEKRYLHAGQYPVGSDSAFLKAKPGEVLGPFMQPDNTIALYKVIGQKFSSDSAKVRHILVAYKEGERADPSITRTLDQAKLRADSILRVVKSGKSKMEDIVEKLTDDPGSKSGNKGDYGWFTEESGFVQEFKDAGFKNPVGATIVVKTSFGYHVIQVLDRTKESAKVQVMPIEKKVEPSDATISAAYNKASQFAGQNNTGELFTKACQKDNLNVLKAADIAEGARMISGVENAREVIRWMYNEETKVGTVSQPFTNGNNLIVCHLTKVLSKGIKPFEEVKEICQLEARKTKKANEFIAAMNKTKGASIDAWAQNEKTIVQPGVNVSLGQPYIQAAGYEGAVVGTLANMKPGQLSAPIKGTMGVYVIMLESVTKPEPLTDIVGQKTRIMQGLAGRADASAAEILKEEANIIDNRAKHF